MYFRKEFGKPFKACGKTLTPYAISFSLFTCKEDEFIWFEFESRKRYFSFGLRNPFVLFAGTKYY